MPAGVVLRVWDCRSLETSPKLPTLGSSEACAVLWPALHSGAARFRISPGAVVQEPSSMVAEPQRRRLSDVLPVSVCVCVHPWTKGSQPTSAGACSICGPLHATKLRPQMGRDQGRLILYLPCVSQAVTPIFLGLLPWQFCMIPPTNPPPPCTALPPTLSVRSFSSAAANSVQQYGFADSCTFPFPRLPSQRGN